MPCSSSSETRLLVVKVSSTVACENILGGASTHAICMVCPLDPARVSIGIVLTLPPALGDSGLAISIVWDGDDDEDNCESVTPDEARARPEPSLSTISSAKTYVERLTPLTLVWNRSLRMILLFGSQVPSVAAMLAKSVQLKDCFSFRLEDHSHLRGQTASRR